jgi:Holliday junction resolvase RusA-like endonuclease
MRAIITIFGDPVAKERPRFCRRGKHVGTYKTEKQQREEVECILDIIRELKENKWTQPDKETPITVFCTFYMPIPKSSTKKFKALCDSVPVRHVKRPDVDNLVKFALDCLNGVAWVDDGQVSEVNAVKLYSTQPRTVVILECEGE